MIHHVGFEEDGGGLIESISKEVAGVDGAGGINLQSGGGFAVMIRNEIGLA